MLPNLVVSLILDPFELHEPYFQGEAVFVYKADGIRVLHNTTMIQQGFKGCTGVQPRGLDKAESPQSPLDLHSDWILFPSFLLSFTLSQ